MPKPKRMILPEPKPGLIVKIDGPATVSVPIMQRITPSTGWIAPRDKYPGAKWVEIILDEDGNAREFRAIQMPLPQCQAVKGEFRCILNAKHAGRHESAYMPLADDPDDMIQRVWASDPAEARAYSFARTK